MQEVPGGCLPGQGVGLAVKQSPYCGEGYGSRRRSERHCQTVTGACGRAIWHGTGAGIPRVWGFLWVWWVRCSLFFMEGFPDLDWPECFPAIYRPLNRRIIFVCVMAATGSPTGRVVG